MKVLSCLAVFLAAILMIPAVALARDNSNQRSITISEPVQVGNAHLNSGTYKVEWNGTGPQVHVMFMSHGKNVATVPATLKSNDQQVKHDDFMTHKTSANVRKLDEIDFAKGKDALLFNKKGA